MGIQRTQSLQIELTDPLKSFTVPEIIEKRKVSYRKVSKKQYDHLAKAREAKRIRREYKKIEPEVKPEEVKPEEVKPEVQPEVKPEVKPKRETFLW